ncbi:MAG TPA: Asp-tRNA(Asn)/Glu-tRNA(Gln) amidotransferase subunit GatC [Candidatus Paceibacterota bacterium]|nr:Asp-tRNA(Asn)/Glu-tRNA(Gln) amidotransferase subunit GatC [Candidatus Paceibacterota bacterium]
MKLQPQDIEHLATLARIKVAEGEQSALAEKIDAVLGYVGEIAKVDTSAYAHTEAGDHRNILRPDVATAQPGAMREAILDNAPKREGDFVRVQQMFE